MGASCWCDQPHDIDHGSYAGYQQHLKLQRAGHDTVEPCDSCKAANNEYMKAWRDRRPELQRRRADKELCRAKALRRLAGMYPDDLECLYTDELRGAGLLPITATQ